MNQKLFPTDPAAMSAKAQDLRNMGEPFMGRGSQAGRTLGLDAVLNLVQEILDQVHIDPGPKLM